MIEVMKQIVEALENSKRTHRYCEDAWYSCPKHEEGCANDAEGDECNCGADEANAVIDAAITSLKQAIAEAEKAKPVAWLQIGLAPLHEGDVIARTTKPTKWNPEWWRFVPLYTHPPQRQQDHIEDNLTMVQEPVAWRPAFTYEGYATECPWNAGKPTDKDLEFWGATKVGIEYAYSSPPQRQPLSDEEMYFAIRPLFKTDALAQASLNLNKDEYRAIEQAHGIKGEA